jgi:hypothetical protein
LHFQSVKPVARSIQTTTSSATFIVGGFSNPNDPCTLEDLYQYDLANGPLGQITRTTEGGSYKYTVNAHINLGRVQTPATYPSGNTQDRTDCYFQIGYAGTYTEDEILILSGNLEANDNTITADDGEGGDGDDVGQLMHAVVAAGVGVCCAGGAVSPQWLGLPCRSSFLGIRDYGCSLRSFATDAGDYTCAGWRAQGASSRGGCL